MFLSDAEAAAPSPATGTTINTTTVPPADTAGEPSPILTAAPLVLIFVVFYFLLIRPQQKKLKEHDDLIKSLRRGDKIVTGGGVIGIIQKIDDEILVVEIAPDVKVRIMRDSISNVVSKTGVANDNKSDEQGK